VIEKAFPKTMIVTPDGCACVEDNVVQILSKYFAFTHAAFNAFDLVCC
jgi:hypothetical protein